jgi:hypothetical protein
MQILLSIGKSKTKIESSIEKLKIDIGLKKDKSSHHHRKKRKKQKLNFRLGLQEIMILKKSANELDIKIPVLDIDKKKVKSFHHLILIKRKKQSIK